MGYSEVYCHLCGVSFNIARRRKPGEPDLGSWDYTGSQCNEPGVDEVESLEQCAENGCCIAVRLKDDDDMVNDPDYAPKEDDDNGPYEYDSDYESTDTMNLDEGDDENDHESTNDTNQYHDFLSSTLIPQSGSRGEPVGDFGYSNNSYRNELILPITSDELPEGYDPEDLEHIPGPTCAEANAYSGSVISLEEMRGCRTAQFLVHKGFSGERWQPDGFHEAWEISEDWFLSGVCDGMRSRDEDCPAVWPVRGGVRRLQADNVNFNPESTAPNDLAMPFHPWCFDIFCRQSRARFKNINVSGLMKWRNSEFNWDDFRNFPRAGDVFAAQDQFWRHNPGAEYLAANPLYVPGLSTLLTGANEERVKDGTGIFLCCGNFESPQLISNTPAVSQTIQNDLLASLPLDIRLYIVGFLGSVDTTNLRIASKSFTKLPNSVWYRFMREEMPWLWEAWDEAESTRIPSPWTTVTANEVEFLNQRREHYSRVLSDEYMPTDKIVDYLLPLPGAVSDRMRLPRANTNWHQVYTRIKLNWGWLRGLRNRRRIWEDVEEIIRRIQECEGR